MSDCDGMPRRYHAMLFPIGPQLDEVEALRRAWDPSMAAEIPAHITLVYPVEHPGVDALRERVKGISDRERAFRLCLGDFRAFPPPDAGCVYIDVRDDDGRLAALRTKAAAPPFNPVEFRAHMTVIHPRTSDRAAEFWRAGGIQEARSSLMIDAIFITSFENGKYAVEARFPLLQA
jgi:2'-5' RNA ligase